jgi:ribosome assembly protein YihI (activator of Der GTPase)
MEKCVSSSQPELSALPLKRFLQSFLFFVRYVHNTTQTTSSEPMKDPTLSAKRDVTMHVKKFKELVEMIEDFDSIKERVDRYLSLELMTETEYKTFVEHLDKAKTIYIEANKDYVYSVFKV